MVSNKLLVAKLEKLFLTGSGFDACQAGGLFNFRKHDPGTGGLAWSPSDMSVNIVALNLRRSSPLSVSPCSVSHDSLACGGVAVRDNDRRINSVSDYLKAYEANCASALS